MYSHTDVNSLSAEQVEQRSRKAKHNRTSVRERSCKPKFLRFPYNHMGDSEEEDDTIAAFLSAHGYRLAPCTIDNTDYKFDETYVLAPARQLARASVAASFR
jgi:peptidoglycan-N-acetylglucosamine deacetylase